MSTVDSKGPVVVISLDFEPTGRWASTAPALVERGDQARGVAGSPTVGKTSPCIHSGHAGRST